MGYFVIWRPLDFVGITPCMYNFKIRTVAKNINGSFRDQLENPWSGSLPLEFGLADTENIKIIKEKGTWGMGERTAFPKGSQLGSSASHRSPSTLGRGPKLPSQE